MEKIAFFHILNVDNKNSLSISNRHKSRVTENNLMFKYRMSNFCLKKMVDALDNVLRKYLNNSVL
jgi:hypothetical protein